MPRDVVGDFNYYSPVIESEHQIKQHFDFVNETGILLQLNDDESLILFLDVNFLTWVISHNVFSVIRVTTCAAVGRYGPTLNQCTKEYNGSELESQVFHTASSTNSSLEEISDFHTIGLWFRLCQCIGNSQESISILLSFWSRSKLL